MKRRFARKATAVAISDVTAAIASTTFNVMPDGRTTACTLKLDNGFIVTGLAHCSPFVTFNPEIGRAAAEDDAREQLFGYLTFAMLEQTYRDSDKTEPGESLREMAMNAREAWANQCQEVERAHAAAQRKFVDATRDNAHPASAEASRIDAEKQAIGQAIRDGFAAIQGGRVIGREEFAAEQISTEIADALRMEAQAKAIIADTFDAAIRRMSPEMRAILPPEIRLMTPKV